MTGNVFGTPDSGYIAMREDFMKQRPDVVAAWLRTELEAQRFILDPKNWNEVAEIVKSQTTGITVPMAWFSLYGQIPPSAGGSAIRDEKPFVFDARIHAQLASIYKFLYESKVIDVGTPPPNAIDDSLARKVVKDAGVTVPLGTIEAQDASRVPR